LISKISEIVEIALFSNLFKHISSESFKLFVANVSTLGSCDFKNSHHFIKNSTNITKSLGYLEEDLGSSRKSVTNQVQSTKSLGIYSSGNIIFNKASGSIAIVFHILANHSGDLLIIFSLPGN